MSDVLVVHAPSGSVEGREYTLHIRGEEVICNCLGFNTHGHCKHADTAKEIIMTDATAVAGTPSVPPEDQGRALTPIRVTPPTTTLPTKGEISVMTMLSRGIVNARGVAVPVQLNSASKVFAVVLAGWELGVKPMTAIRHIAIVNGRTEPDAQLMMGMVKAKEPDADFTIIVDTPEEVVVRFVRPSRGGRWEIGYSKAEAQKSGQWTKKGPWQEYPRDMMRWAAIKRACKLFAPDLINSITPVAVSEADEVLLAEPAPSGDADAIDAAFEELTKSPANYSDGDTVDGEYTEQPIDAAEPERQALPAMAERPLAGRIEDALAQFSDAERAKLIDAMNIKYGRKVLTERGQTMMRNGPTDAEKQEMLAFLETMLAQPEPGDDDAEQLPMK